MCAGKEKLNEWPDTDTAEDLMDNQTGRKATFDPERRAVIQAQMLCGARVRTCVSALRKPLFYGEFVKFKFVVSFIALAVFCSAVAPAQEKQIDWRSVGGGYLSQTTEGATGNWTSTHDWYVLPTFNINRQVKRRSSDK